MSSSKQKTSSEHSVSAVIEDLDGTLISSRVARDYEGEFNTRPPFPKSVNVELNNVCNHLCTFCAYRTMEREVGNIQRKNLEKWLVEAYQLGARELGLHSGAEPLASPHLEHFIRFAKKVGYEYTYFSTNGSLATPERLQKIVDAGIDSIKFSINAGDRDTYQKVHGRDHFDRVVANLRAASEIRGKRKKPYLAISFVITDENRHTMEILKDATQDLINEFFAIEALNQSGQVVSETTKGGAPAEICGIPFNKVSISWEGFLRVCCNDYENLLAVENLNEMPLKEAYYSPKMEEIRRRHIENNLKGTLCYNCMRNCQTPVQPLNPDLYFQSHKNDKGPKASNTEKIFR